MYSGQTVTAGKSKLFYGCHRIPDLRLGQTGAVVESIGRYGSNTCLYNKFFHFVNIRIGPPGIIGPTGCLFHLPPAADGQGPQLIKVPHKIVAIFTLGGEPGLCRSLFLSLDGSVGRKLTGIGHIDGSLAGYGKGQPISIFLSPGVRGNHIHVPAIILIHRCHGTFRVKPGFRNCRGDGYSLSLPGNVHLHGPELLSGILQSQTNKD